MTHSSSLSEINSGYILEDKMFGKSLIISVKKVCSPQADGLQFYLEQVNQDFLDLIFKNFLLGLVGAQNTTFLKKFSDDLILIIRLSHFGNYWL